MVSMERGTISLTNLELTVLYEMALAQGCDKQDLVDKLQPVPGAIDQSQEHIVQISEEEAEIMLDCMPMPSPENDPNLVSSRIKIQQFLAHCRFPEET